jgi:hypothetical protein
MKIVVPALATVLLGGIGATSAAQAGVINFSAVALCPVTCTGISYTGSNLGLSTAVDLDGSTWIVSLVGASDNSGLAAGNPIVITPHPLAGTYGALSGPVDVTLATSIVKTWTATVGPNIGDMFTETLTKLTEVDRGLNAIAFTFNGTVTDTGSVFDPAGASASMVLSLTQAGGPRNVVSASLTNSAASAVPEPATWVMMGLGFVALGYAAVRRSPKDRSALAV